MSDKFTHVQKRKDAFRAAADTNRLLIFYWCKEAKG